ncbi:serpentine type 7TM GPCR chemoreceptor srsx domain-containing protein [Ditylenchus destructor]|uniref:Serpentine type 7TM GPCR chemoreceptor srsx domain-containing protein n=1 Tax=Ditylenchus destructor TaxID=166010 RepID=A0AAD4MK32_9BILA|nr:serpentine type 7TM GPCR chemoreceptor srsx domain-containing protein [Ditylenchus destructor]
MENTNLSAPVDISMFSVFNGKGHSFGVIWPAVLINLIGIPGQLMNVFVVYVTLRNRSMRSTCNYLLAMLSFFEFLHQTGHLVALYVALSGINFIPYLMSMNFQIQAMFGLHAAQIALMAIALDRLLSVLLPVMSRNFKPRHYMLFVTVPCFSIGIFGAVNCYLVVLSNPHLPVTGHMSDLFTVDTISEPFNDICLCSNIINVVCYVVIGLMLRMSLKTIGMDQKYNRRIYKALVAIVLVVLGGYLINVVFGKFIVNSGLYGTSIEKWYGTQIFCAYPAAIAAASHAPILYSFR